MDDVDELKAGHAQILKAIKDNTDMTQPIAEMIGMARWFFKTIGWIGRAGRKCIVWVTPILTFIGVVWALVWAYLHGKPPSIS